MNGERVGSLMGLSRQRHRQKAQAVPRGRYMPRHAGIGKTLQANHSSNRHRDKTVLCHRCCRFRCKLQHLCANTCTHLHLAQLLQQYSRVL